MLEVNQLNSGYGKVPILNNVTLSIKKGETVAVIGPNGAGKSTLLKTLSGLIPPTSGEICLDGQNVAGLSPDKINRLGISYVPEGGRPFPNMTVLDNLLMGAYAHRASLKDGTMDEMYTLFPILKKRSDQYARNLSGGERQMLAIARGLVNHPKLLMLDEPSLGLAPKLIDDIYDSIYLLKEKGLTVLLIEQNTSYALELADRAYVLENGSIVLQGQCSELSQSDHVRKAYLGL